MHAIKNDLLGRGKYQKLVYSEAFPFFCTDSSVQKSNTAFHADETDRTWALHVLQQAVKFPNV